MYMQFDKTNLLLLCNPASFFYEQMTSNPLYLHTQEAVMGKVTAILFSICFFTVAGTAVAENMMSDSKMGM